MRLTLEQFYEGSKMNTENRSILDWDPDETFERSTNRTASGNLDQTAWAATRDMTGSYRKYANV